MTTIQDVLDFVALHADQPDIENIWAACKRRQKYLRDNRAASNAASLRPGDRVRLSGLSPKYLNGLTGEVVDVLGGTKVQVKLFDGTNRFQAGIPYTVPASCLTKVA